MVMEQQKYFTMTPTSFTYQYTRIPGLFSQVKDLLKKLAVEAGKGLI